METPGALRPENSYSILNISYPVICYRNDGEVVKKAIDAGVV